jgi:PPOX class probable F420-dependent enzyme
VDEADMRRRVGSARVARLATVDDRGRPHLVPICFALDEDTLYTAVDTKPKRSRRLKRLANVRVHPDVTVLVDQYEEEWTRLWWVRLRGRARVVEQGAELERALALLTEKYDQYRRHPPPGPAIVVAIEEWSGWEGAEG